MPRIDAPIAKADAFARRLKEAIAESDVAKLNSTQQADALGISKGLLSQWKNGRTATPDYPLVKGAADRLRVSVEWLLGERVTAPAKPAPMVSERSTVYNDASTSETPEMTLQQQKDAMAQLMESIPHTAREKYLEIVAREALQEGWIKSIPDEMMVRWSASEKIAALQKKRPPHTQ